MQILFIWKECLTTYTAYRNPIKNLDYTMYGWRRMSTICHYANTKGTETCYRFRAAVVHFWWLNLVQFGRPWRLVGSVVHMFNFINRLWSDFNYMQFCIQNKSACKYHGEMMHWHSSANVQSIRVSLCGVQMSDNRKSRPDTLAWFAANILIITSLLASLTGTGRLIILGAIAARSWSPQCS